MAWPSEIITPFPADNTTLRVERGFAPSGFMSYGTQAPSPQKIMLGQVWPR